MGLAAAAVGAGLAAALLVAAGMFSSFFSGKPFFAVFPWHPVLMTTGFSAMMTAGRAAYLWDSDAKQINKRRQQHGWTMAAAALCILLGYAAIFVAHQRTGASHFAAASSPIRKIHVYAGYLSLVLMVVVLVVGGVKIRFLVTQGEKRYPWHGQLGKAVMYLGAVTEVIGVLMWSWPLAYAGLVAVVMVVAALLGIGTPRQTGPAGGGEVAATLVGVEVMDCVAVQGPPPGYNPDPFEGEPLCGPSEADDPHRTR
mmetsp:Transcript_23056/g.59293  ORF Transcript_23056/g.59293 Transcript_23056/m.59293 type:complete len:255 (-) Transcript_23056:51-815(-)